MTAILGLLLAIAKAFPAAARLAEILVDLEKKWNEHNASARKDQKDAAVDAVIDQRFAGRMPARPPEPLGEADEPPGLSRGG